METSAEIFSKIDFKSLFRDFNRAKKRKLTQRDKNLIKLLVNRYLPMTAEDRKRMRVSIRDLQKSLSAHSPPRTLKGGMALKVEPLDVVLRCVTFDDKHIKLHKLLKKGKKNGKQVVQATNRLRRRRKLRVR